MAGAHDHVEATAKGEPLPPPKRTPTANIADPASYADDASKAVDEARSMVPWWEWLAGAGAAALGVLRFISGAGGVVANTAWRLLAPQQDKIADSQRETHAAGFRQLVSLIDGLRDEHTIAMLKADISTKAPASVGDAIKRLALIPSQSEKKHHLSAVTTRNHSCGPGGGACIGLLYSPVRSDWA